MAYDYYPIRYLMTRPYVKAVYKSLQEHSGGVNPALARRLLLEQIEPWLTAQGWKSSGPDAALEVLSQELQGGLAWADWALRGRQLIGVEEPLCHAFEHSDCADLHIEDVLPESATTLYLHFQGVLETPLYLAEGAILEGAYVINYQKNPLRIVLCARSAAGTPIGAQWKERYDLRIAPQYWGIGSEEALDFALADDLADIDAALKSAERSGSEAGVQALRVLAQRMAEGHATFKSALRLVLNSLAYLKGYPQDATPGWAPGAPSRLVEQTHSASSKEQARAKSKLWALGFTPVTFLGKDFVSRSVASAKFGGLRTHWRRGHWRHQPYGPALALRKLIWLQPTLVGAGPES